MSARTISDNLIIREFTARNKYRRLVACIDDSLMISQMMEQIISLAGYRFIAINDPLTAIATLINRQPDF